MIVFWGVLVHLQFLPPEFSGWYPEIGMDATMSMAVTSFSKNRPGNWKVIRKNWPHKKKHTQNSFPEKTRARDCLLCFFRFGYTFTQTLTWHLCLNGWKTSSSFARLAWVQTKPLGVDCLAAKLPTQAGQGVGWMGLYDHSMWRNDHSCWVTCQKQDISDKWILSTKSFMMDLLLELVAKYI